MKKITILKTNSLNQIMVLMCFLFFNALQAQTTYTSASALITAVKAAGTTGGTFILKNGSYSNFQGGFTDLNQTTSNPIIIKAETVGGVTLTGNSYFTFKRCAHITVEGFNIIATGSSTLVKLEGSNNIRITRNVFDLTTTVAIKWVYIGGVWDDTVFPYNNPSHHNRIDHNTFQNKRTAGHYITIDGNNSKHQSQYDRIDHNYFKDNGPRAVNEQESIRVGWSDMSKSSGFTTVEYNLFENCDGDPEIVSVKSCDNIIRHNTFRGSYGTLSFRHGNRNRAEGNYFFGNGREIGNAPAPNESTKLYTGGMRVYGTDHVIINNYFEGLNGTKWDAPITLTQGDAIEGSSSDLTKHYRIERLLVAYNTLVNNDQGIEIGFSNNGAYGQKMKDVTIANNLITSDRNSLVKIVDGKDQGSDITWKNNLMYPTGSATLISGATTTTLSSSSQVINENPNLVFNSATGTWKSTASTPLYANASSVANEQDIDGQSRPSTSNPGADHFSMESVRYMPMTTATVGPSAYENIPLALSAINSFSIGEGSQTTNVTTNLSWTATVDSPSWLSVNNASGTGNGSIVITATANNSGATRAGLLTVTGDGIDPVTLTVTQVGPTLTLSAISNLVAAGESKMTTVSSNVAWTASIDNPSWLSISPSSGTNNGSITVTATANTTTTSRSGTLTVIGGGLTRTLTITQDGKPSGAVLINAGVAGAPVTVTATQEQVDATRSNYAINTLDKDTGTRWSDLGTGSTTAPYGVLTYDFGGVYTLESIKIATTGTSTKFYYYGIQFSIDGVNYSTMVDVTSDLGTAFKTYLFTDQARYVKITGKGNNSSAFSTISEIEFYGQAVLSVKKNQLNNAFTVYPNPVSATLYMQSSLINASHAIMYTMDGKEVLNSKLTSSDASLFSMDVSSLQNGTYLLKILNESGAIVGTKMVLVKN
ncbi:chondroitinase-B domain-containing protein [Flavobacterium sp. NG2]|uniref:chondroitinase-B domain-containing protein n=1 Tax=Flavobacterium sp. NG2 TaxID=3097547 RepID=UPI002A7FFCB4|nr:chondroitinase-B domain-containing protein [Flavobacterium sp. NG2]WPR72130.1 chondroitinase-B domain-containing protein [Flavobacterium sp. NG2]